MSSGPSSERGEIDEIVVIGHSNRYDRYRVAHVQLWQGYDRGKVIRESRMGNGFEKWYRPIISSILYMWGLAYQHNHYNPGRLSVDHRCAHQTQRSTLWKGETTSWTTTSRVTTAWTTTSGKLDWVRYDWVRCAQPWSMLYMTCYIISVDDTVRWMWIRCRDCMWLVFAAV